MTRPPCPAVARAALATLLTAVLLAGGCAKVAQRLKDQQNQRWGPVPTEARPVSELPPNPHGAARVVRQGDHWFEVGGRPYLILGVQPDAWSIDEPTAAAARQFDHAVALRANTVQVQIPWGKVEPTRDGYRMDYVRWVLDQVERTDLNLMLLWFGSNVVGKSGSPTGLDVLPPYVQDDPATYSRIGAVPTGKPLKMLAPERPFYDVLDPADPDTLEREKRAFRKVLEYVRREDRGRRVVAWQILNEVGAHPEYFGGLDRGRFSRGLVRYVGELTELQQQVHPVPSYMNFWEGLVGAEPFAFLDGIPKLDFVGQDVYGNPGGFKTDDADYKHFRDVFSDSLERYTRGRNLVFIPETNTDVYYRTHLSPFYLAPRPKAGGLSVWAITHGSHRGFDPLIDKDSGAFRPGGALLAEVYEAFRRVMEPLIRARGQRDAVKTFVSEDGGSRPVNVGGRRIEASAQAQGAVIAFEAPGGGGPRVGSGDLVVIGRKITLTIPGASRAERGTFDGMRFRSLGPADARPVAGGALQLELDRADVVRVR